MKTKQNLAVALIAIGFLTASCVDNAVSPQVEAIRAQQVEWMKAKTASEVALAAVQTALADYQKAQTANQISVTATAAAIAAEDLKQKQAINALALISQAEKDRNIAAVNANTEKTNLMNYDKAKAANDVLYAQYQTQLATEKVNLANATAALAAATVNATVNANIVNAANATNYYTNYVTTSNNVVALTQSKMANAKLIADNNIAIAFATTSSTIDMDQLGANKKKLQYDLAALTANLAAYNAAAIDPTATQTQIDNLNKQNIKYQASIDSATIVLANKTNDIAAKNNVYVAATNTVAAYSTLKSNWSSQQTDSISKEAIVLSTAKSIATASTTLAADNAYAATQLEIYTNAKVNSDAKQATYDASKGSSDAAAITLTKANAALTLATANLNADPTNAALITAKANATTAQTTAQTAYNAAMLITNTASINLNNALNITNPAKTNSDNATMQVKSDQANLSSLQASLVTRQQDLADAKTNIKVTRDKIVAMTADYQKAITTSAALYNTYQAALDDKQKTQDVINAKTILYNANTGVISKLYSSLSTASSIQTSIVTTQNNIAITKDNIAGIDKQIASVDATNGKDLLVNTNARLALENAAIDIEITNATKLATYWKGLLDKLFV